MGNRHLHKIECIQTLGTLESEQIDKGYRSKSFPPDRLFPFSKSRFFHITTQYLWGEGEGDISNLVSIYFPLYFCLALLFLFNFCRFIFSIFISSGVN